MRLIMSAMVVMVIAGGIALFGLVAFESFPAGSVQGEVISVNSWTGGDLTHYYNVTVLYQGHLYTQVITCDYYIVNSALPLARTSSGTITGFEATNLLGPGTGMPVGC